VNRNGLEAVTDTVALERIEPIWRELAARRGNPFLTPEWFGSWLRHYGDDADPFVPVVCRPDGSVRGLMPFVVSGRRSNRTLRFAGADFGDYFHPVSPEGVDEEAVAIGAAHVLRTRRGEWSTVVADYVDDEARWVQSFVSNRSLRLHAVPYHEHRSLYYSISLRGSSWDGYLASRSSNFRSQLGRKRRALEREHEVRFRLCREPASVDRDMQTLFELHLDRWRTRGRTTLDSERARAFHLDFARAAAEQGWLRLWFLEVGGETVAGWYGWRLGNKYLYYQAGFDPAWGAHSPGLLLLARTIEAAFEEGAAEYDLLLGDEEYKTRFATGSRTARTVVMTRTLHPMRVVVSADVGLRRVTRRLPARYRRRLRHAVRPLADRWPVRTAP
jgi:CelD/BcsL family acetyltransferase involved in cellulose biosynthesis